MRKRILTAITAALAGALLLGAGVAAASADVDDFAIESFDAVYELSRDEAGRSSLETVEHIVAVFPDFDASAFVETASESHQPGEKDDHAFVFRVLDRL